MTYLPAPVSRRHFLAGSAGLLAAGRLPAEEERRQRAADSDKALIAITLDLEMSRNFPTWDQTHWDYEKGNLNAPTKQYTVEACRRVKEHGGVLPCFVVGRVLEQENVDWLKQIVRAGHPLGNHTYDHVNVLATRPEDIQFRFRRAPWLIAGKTPREVIAENIRLTSAALKTRLGVEPVGFRTPGGFGMGLAGQTDFQQLLLALGFPWVSSKYPTHPVGSVGKEPGPEIFETILKVQEQAQPFVYPTGLVEVPINPVTDIVAFRSGRWPLASFLKAVRLAAEWAIEHRAVFDFTSHPSCLYVTDPEFRAIELICDLVRKASERAALVDLGTLAQRARLRQPSGG